MIIGIRAWDRLNKVMVYFDTFSPCVEYRGILFEARRDSLNSKGDIPGAYTRTCPDAKPKQYVLTQFTGLLDKNGKEIYEGDIVENYAMRDEVIFDNGAFVGKNSQKDQLGQHQPIAVHNEIEVIGNIYEHPELLKGTP